MPNEPNGNETPVSNPVNRAIRSQQIEAKFFEDLTLGQSYRNITKTRFILSSLRHR